MQEPCLPLCIDPIHSHADTYDQGDVQLSGSLHMAFYHVLSHRSIEPGPDAGEAGEVLLDESIRVILSNAELAGQSERALPVDRGEVDRLRASAHFRGDLVLGHVEDDRRRLAVNVPAL